MPDALGVGALCGFAGKVPARGDFVRAGLPRDFLDPWHDWQSRVIAGSRATMGESWLDAFLEAPVWRFRLRAGVCGPRVAAGLMMPSVDRVGRYFPLTFAALAGPAGMPGDPVGLEAWLDAAEALGRLALDEDAPPERLRPLPCPDLPADPGCACLWWTEGGPRVEAVRLSLPDLPDAARFAAMLGHPQPGHPQPGNPAATESAP